MPESRPRKKDGYSAPTTSRKPAMMGSSRWVAPIMVSLWIIGLVWIVVFYLAPNMVLIAVGFIFATKWE